MKAVVISYLGTGRENQEDNYFLYPDQILPVKDNTGKKKKHYLTLEKVYKKRCGIFAVADGMGGYKHGEVASTEAVSYLRQNAGKIVSLAESSEDVHIALQSCMEQINHSICCRKKELCQNRMGTTLAAVIVSGENIFSVGIGDSRIYRYNQELQLLQITTDQNQGTRMLNMGMLDAKDYAQFPYRKALYQYLGMEQYEEQIIAQYKEWRIPAEGEWMLITTDGLTDELSQVEINNILSIYYAMNHIAGAARELLERAVNSAAGRNRGTDNITLIIVSLFKEKAGYKQKSMISQEEIKMAFWDQVSRKVTEKSQEAINYGKNVADTVKLNSMISDEEKKVEALYYQIGKKYVDKFYGNYDEIFRDELLQMKNSLELIQNYKDQINELKGTQICERCGAEVPKGSAFCSSCGNKMPEPKANIPAGGRLCPNCGAVIQEGDRFCMGCGSRLEAPVNQQVEQEDAEVVYEEGQPVELVGEGTEEYQETTVVKEKSLKICKNCGSSLGEEDIFCVNCGTRVE